MIFFLKVKRNQRLRRNNKNHVMMDIKQDDVLTCSPTVLTMAQQQDFVSVKPCNQEAVVAVKEPVSKKTKHVRFNEDANEFYSDTTQMCYEDRRKLLRYSGRKNAHFRREWQAHINEFRKSGTAAGRYRPSSYLGTLYQVYEACRKCCPVEDENYAAIDDDERVLTAKQKTKLQHWMQQCTTPIGIERHVVRGLDQRRKDVVRAVLGLQEKWEKSEKPVLEHERSESLRKASQVLSRPSRIFARQLAIAKDPVDPFFQ